MFVVNASVCVSSWTAAHAAWSQQEMTVSATSVADPASVSAGLQESIAMSLLKPGLAEKPRQNRGRHEYREEREGLWGSHELKRVFQRIVIFSPKCVWCRVVIEIARSAQPASESVALVD